MKLVIILLILLSFLLSYEAEKDYTNLTQDIAPYPDIAIDIRKKYGNDYIRLLWEISLKDHTRKE